MVRDAQHDSNGIALISITDVAFELKQSIDIEEDVWGGRNRKYHRERRQVW